MKTEAKQKAKMKNLDLEKHYKMLDSLARMKEESEALALELYMQIKNDTIFEKLGRLISLLSGKSRQAYFDYMTNTIERLKKGDTPENIIADLEKNVNDTVYVRQSAVKTTPVFELRQQSGMNLTQFSKYFNIPYRTIQNWERGERECPAYLLDLMKYKLEKEKII